MVCLGNEQRSFCHFWDCIKVLNKCGFYFLRSQYIFCHYGNKYQVGRDVEKAMAPHSSTLAWKIPWMEEPGRLQSMGSQRVRHDWMTSLSLFTFHFHALEKEMATHSSVLAWRIPGAGEPGGLPSMGSQRVGHDWSDLVVVVGRDEITDLSHIKKIWHMKTCI